MFRHVHINNVTTLQQPASEFYKIAQAGGYSLNTNPDFHQYFKWRNLKKHLFYYEHLSNEELFDIFSRTIIYQKDISFIICLGIRDPLVKVNFRSIANHLEDISFYEASCMGWEAVSTCGSFIFEFMDESEGIFVANFEIPGYKKLLDEKDIKWAIAWND